MSTINIERGVTLHDSGLTDAEIREAVAPAMAVFRAAGITATQAYDTHIAALKCDPMIGFRNSDDVYNSVWAQAEHAITADLRESAVMALA